MSECASLKLSGDFGCLISLVGASGDGERGPLLAFTGDLGPFDGEDKGEWGGDFGGFFDP